MLPQGLILMQNGLNGEEMAIVQFPSLLAGCDVISHCTLKESVVPYQGNVTHMEYVVRDEDDDNEYLAVCLSYGGGVVPDEPCGIYDDHYYKHEQSCRREGGSFIVVPKPIRERAMIQLLRNGSQIVAL